MPARRVSIDFMSGTRSRISAPELRRIARHVLMAEDVAPEVELELMLADAASSRELNRLYRGSDEPTDVLSFAAMDEAPMAPGPFLEAPDATPSLGEIVICIPVVEQQASAAGREVQGEIAHLLVHGLLHLLGHDHELGEAESQRMQQREDELLAGLGYAGRYAHGH